MTRLIGLALLAAATAALWVIALKIPTGRAIQVEVSNSALPGTSRPIPLIVSEDSILPPESSK